MCQGSDGSSDDEDAPMQPQYMLASDFQQAMQNYTADINSRTSTLVQSLSDSCQRQFSAIDARVSRIEMAASSSQSEQAAVNAEFKKEIEDVKRQLAVDS
eukprot:5124246-Karenia_brevis.AAC.1